MEAEFGPLSAAFGVVDVWALVAIWHGGSLGLKQRLKARLIRPRHAALKRRSSTSVDALVDESGEFGR